MKNTRILLGVILLFSVFGCRKNLDKKTSADLNENFQTQSFKENLNIDANGIISSDWQSTDDWIKVHLPTHTVYHTNLKTAATTEYPSQEIIRVFKNLPQGNDAQSLPYEEIKNGSKYYWYYTVTKGNVMIAVDVYGSAIKPNATDQFKTIVFTPKAITTLQSKDKIKIQLSKLPYKKIAALAK